MQHHWWLYSRCSTDRRSKDIPQHTYTLTHRLAKMLFCFDWPSFPQSCRHRRLRHESGCPVLCSLSEDRNPLKWQVTWSQPNTFSNNQANTKELNLHLQQADTMKQGTGTYWTIDIHTNTTLNTMHFELTVKLTRCLASLETPQLTSLLSLSSHLCLP